MDAESTDRDGLCETDRDSIGGHIGVEIPLKNRMLFHDVADALRGLAQVMETQSCRKGLSEFDSLVRVRFEVRHTNNIIRAACRRYDLEIADQPLGPSDTDARSGPVFT